MSDRERAMSLLESVPDYKIGYVLALLPTKKRTMRFVKE